MIRPNDIRIVELKWNQMARPDVINRAPIAPVRGQGLGSTMWYACAWCAIRRFLVNKGLIGEQIHKLGLSPRQLQVVSARKVGLLSGWQLWV